MNKNNFYSLTVYSALMLALQSCCGVGGGSNNNNNNGDANSLQVITPKTIYSKLSTQGSSYVIVRNPTNKPVTNLHYSLDNFIGGGVGSEIDPITAASCATIESNSQCNVKVSVPSGAIAGSIGFNISNTTLLGKLSGLLKESKPLPTIGVQQEAYNNLSGADGISLS